MSPQLKPAEQRSILRLPCAIPVARGGHTASIGEISNISLDGMFIATPNPLPHGSVVPLAFKLGNSDVCPSVEVVRTSPQGMGVRYHTVSKQDLRRLRRYVADLANVVNNQRTAQRYTSTVSDAQQKRSFTEPAKIRRLLEEALGRVTFTIIPRDRPLREQMPLTLVSDHGLSFETARAAALHDNEDVFVLCTMNYASYSFATTVTSASPTHLTLALPTAIIYSERRTSERQDADGGTVSVALPWKRDQVQTWPLVESTAQGLSFLAGPDEGYFWPNVKLPSITLNTPRGSQTFAGAVVKHITACESPEGAPKLRIGLEFEQENAARVAQETLVSETQRTLSLAAKWRRDLTTKASYLFQKTLQRVRPGSQDTLPLLVHFHNTRKQRLTGLLNLSTKDDKKQRMPLVIVAPGFGARKETMSALALTLAENFRANNKDIAVLRYDGSNGIGESYKDPGCETDGRENLHYTISGGVSDILGAMKWAKSNALVEPTDIIIISVSFSAIAVRHALTLPEMASVRHWISFMGAPEMQNAIMNVAGNVDAYGLFLEGNSPGVVSLLGCMVDADHFCIDIQKLKAATLEDARREMAQVRANLTWFIGKNDAFMDAARVRDIMAVRAPGKRNIVEVNAGHVPQSSDEALAEFAIMTRHLWRELYGHDVDARAPSLAKIALAHQWEWDRVRKSRLDSQEDYWKGYLLGGTTGLGYDVWSLTPEYDGLLNDTLGMTKLQNKRVLDLGSGTGNLSMKIFKQEPAALTCVDLVPEALERLRAKLAPQAPVTLVAASADGSPWVAARRWMQGDLHSFEALVASLPPTLARGFDDIKGRYNASLHTYLRGSQIDLATVAKEAGLSSAAARDLQNLRLICGLSVQKIDEAEARKHLTEGWPELLDGPRGLPFDDGAFDVVTSSLVLSYMERVADTLYEVRRVLEPGGVFVCSTLVPDADSSKFFMNAIKHYESVPDREIPQGMERAVILQALREFLDRGAGLLRLEEEGVFHFWSPEDFERLLVNAGFTDITLKSSFGDPSQAVIACARK